MSVFGGDGLTAAEMITIHRRFCEQEFQADLAARRSMHGDDALHHDLPRTAAQRSFDATVEIFRRAAAADTAGVPTATVVNIVVDAATFARMQATSGLAPTEVGGVAVDPFTGLTAPGDLLGDLVVDIEHLADVRCETDSGVPLHPHDVLRASLAGHVRRVVVDTAGCVIDYGRKQRLYTGAAREAALLLLRRCEHPGCDLPTEFCDVDHNVEWNDDGPTDQVNAGGLCPGHNTAKHRKRWRRRRSTTGRSYTVRVDGTIMLPVGVRSPEFIDDSNDDPMPWVDPSSPDEIERLRHLARQRVRALHSDAA